jgi:hypothetical protein
VVVISRTPLSRTGTIRTATTHTGPCSEHVLANLHRRDAAIESAATKLASAV